MQFTTDGVRYAPACAISSRIGIAISAHQRADVLKRALEQHMKHMLACALVVVVDDGSKPAAAMRNGTQQLRHAASLGILSPNIYCQTFYDGSSRLGCLPRGGDLASSRYL